MLGIGSAPQHDVTPLRSDLGRHAIRARSRVEPNSWRFVLVTSVGVGIVSFLSTELLHYLLVPDLGRHRERLLAEMLSALVVSCLVARLVQNARRQHRLAVARMEMIAEVNHHIRNALTPMSLSTSAIDNQQLVRLISEGVDRIDWALREILSREIPLQEERLDKLGYFQSWRGGQQ
jgi:signal transduction histidine kinase